MPPVNHALTASNIKYLLAISSLSGGNGSIRCVNVANALGITKPSVHMMIKTLCSMKLAAKAKYGTVQLTPEGAELAELYSRYYAVVKDHFENKLGLSTEEAGNAACLLLAEIPSEELDKMCRSILLLNQAARQPIDREGTCK